MNFAQTELEVSIRQMLCKNVKTNKFALHMQDICGARHGTNQTLSKGAMNNK